MQNQCFDMGNRYFLGQQGEAQDREAAYHWYKSAADEGHAGAQHSLGLMYHFGQGVEKNTALAALWYAKAAESGYQLSQLALAELYYKHEKDYEKAYHWYELLAAEGHPSALYYLGCMYENGQWVYESRAIAVEYHRRAAAKGHVGAKIRLEKISAQL